jgi:hypothetical protein
VVGAGVRLVIRVYDSAGNVIETHEHAGDFKEPQDRARMVFYCRMTHDPAMMSSTIYENSSSNRVPDYRPFIAYNVSLFVLNIVGLPGARVAGNLQQASICCTRAAIHRGRGIVHAQPVIPAQRTGAALNPAPVIEKDEHKGDFKGP